MMRCCSSLNESRTGACAPLPLGISRARSEVVDGCPWSGPGLMSASLSAAEAAGVVVMDNSLKKVDEFMHISRRMRIIALQSAVGGMALSIIGMVIAATGHLTPVAGAMSQEVIDILAVLNALRAAFPPKVINDL